jgi:hypothetical protein
MGPQLIWSATTCAALAQQLGQWTERWRLVGLTVAMLQIGTLHGEGPKAGAKHRVMPALAVAELTAPGGRDVAG